jgi:DNA-binding NarL/FixJ family response regulator
LTDHYFITPSGRLRERWRDAFPDAVAVEDPTDFSVGDDAGKSMLWFEISACESDKKEGWLKALVALGHPVIVLSATPEESEAFLMLTLGSSGYCHVYAAPGHLQQVADAAQNGGIWLPPELMQRLVAVSLRMVESERRLNVDLTGLTARELAVAEEVAQGASNREIAGDLGISERTVKSHLSSVFEKLQVRDRVQLALAVSKAFSG